MTKKKVDPTQRMGKRTGYRVEGSRYYLAPVLQEQIVQLHTRKLSLNVLLEAVLAFYYHEQTAVKAAEIAWWQNTLDDLGFPPPDDKNIWDYSTVGGYIKKAMPPMEEKKEA